MAMMTDDQFITSKSHRIIDFKPKTGLRTRGIPVGKYFIITSGFTVYNSVLRVPLIQTKFDSVIDAHEFCERLIKIYGHLLCILIDENYSKEFFLVTRYTIKHGMMIYNGIRSFEDLNIIKRSDLAFIGLR